MPPTAQTLQTHLRYTTWATNRLLEAASNLSSEERERDFGTADKSVLGTLVHLFAADRVWLARIHGGPPDHFSLPRGYDLARLSSEWAELFGRWEGWGAALTDDSAEARISYSDSKGIPWVSPVWQIVLHVVNHGTHHRGQVSGFLRAMGRTPPVLDLIAFYRQRG